MKSATQHVLRGTLKLALALFVLNAVCTQAESPPDWAKAARFGGSGTDAGATVRVTKYGDRYVTGSFSSTSARRASAGRALPPLAAPTFSSPNTRPAAGCFG